MRVLIVEDDKDLSKVIEQTLLSSDESCEISTAQEGNDGYAKAMNYDYDVIILDLMLPGMSGETILHSLRKSKATPVIVLTAIDEFAIGYTYTDIYGSTNDNIYTARIIRVEGYDPNVTGPQYVTFYTEPIEGYNILTNFDNLLRATSEHKISFEGYRVSGWIDVNAQIQSVRGKAAYGANANVTDEFSGGESVTQIAVGREVGSSSQYYASQLYEVEITYTDGSVKTVGIDAEMDEFTFSNPSIVEYEYQTRYSILGGGFTKRWVAKAVGETDMTLPTPLGDLTWHVQITENTI